MATAQIVDTRDRLRAELTDVRSELAAVATKIRDAGDNLAAIEKLIGRKVSLEARDAVLIEALIAEERQAINARIEDAKQYIAELDRETAPELASIKEAEDAFEHAQRRYQLFQGRRRSADTRLRTFQEQLREFPARERELREEFAHKKSSWI